MLSVDAGKSIVLRTYFYEYENGSLYDPTDDNVHPKLSIYFDNTLKAGPFTYSNGAGEITRDSKGNYFYVFHTALDFNLGFWTAKWEADLSTVGVETFEIEAPTTKTPTIRAMIVDEFAGESNLY